MASKLDAALQLISRGFPVFPVTPNAKTPPLVKNWPAAASAETAAVTAWWERNPDANTAIHCKGLAVIDVDSAKGGHESLAFLRTIHDLPETLTTRTPSGGLHLFYRLPDGHPGVPNSVEFLGKGLDIRSTGGYVIAPGSEINGNFYVIETDARVADAPEWLVTKLGTVAPKADNSAPVDDAPQSVLENAVKWLAGQPPAIQGQGGDAHTFKIVCALRDYGLSQTQALYAILAWNDICEPPWSEAELETKVRNAYSYAQNEPGARVALPSDFPIVEQQAPAKPRPRASVLPLREFANSEARGPGYIIKGFLQRRSYAELFGAPGAGKTFVALDMAYHVAAGIPWMDRKVHQGVALYLPFEGTGGIYNRARALMQKYGTDDVPLFIASGASLNMRELAGRQALGEIIAQLPAKPSLIVFDTFAHALCGGDENSAQDVGAFNSAVAALIASTGACVMIVHHSGKNKAAGARGSSALLGAIDTELEADEGAVISRKQRDIEACAPVGFKLLPVTVGIDEDGDPETSCVVEPEMGVKCGNKAPLKGNARAGYEVLIELRPTNHPVTAAEWMEACREFLGDKGVNKRFFDIKTTLKRKGYIDIDPDGMITRTMI